MKLCHPQREEHRQERSTSQPSFEGALEAGMPETSHRDVLVASPAKEGWEVERVHARNFEDSVAYSSSKLVAQDTTLLRKAIAPVS